MNCTGEDDPCPGHPNQPAIHCGCPDGRATHPCEVCETTHTGPTCQGMSAGTAKVIQLSQTRRHTPPRRRP